MYTVFDMSEYKNVIMSASGTKEKRWFEIPESNNLVLFKLPVSLTSDTWSFNDETSGEIWSEKIVYEVGKFLDINVQRVDLAYINASDHFINHFNLNPKKVNGERIYGVMCHSFLDTDTVKLVEGADMIMEYDHTYERKLLKGDIETYNYCLLEKIFNKWELVSKLNEMVILDALVGNTDRHQDNLGILIDSKTGEIKFAPIYDNSSCLAREFGSKRIEQLISDKIQLQCYINKSKSLVGTGNHNPRRAENHFIFIRDVLERHSDLKEVISRLYSFNNDVVFDIISKIPDEIMSLNQKKVVRMILGFRRDALIREIELL